MTDPIRQRLEVRVGNSPIADTGDYEFFCYIAEVGARRELFYAVDGDSEEVEAIARKMVDAYNAAQSAGREQEARPVAWIALPELQSLFAATNNKVKHYAIVWNEPTGSAGTSLYTAPPPPSAPASVPVSDAVRALVAKWRNEFKEMPCIRTGALATCADELEAALAGSAGEPSVRPPA